MRTRVSVISQLVYDALSEEHVNLQIIWFDKGLNISLRCPESDGTKIRLLSKLRNIQNNSISIIRLYNFKQFKTFLWKRIKRKFIHDVEHIRIYIVQTNLNYRHVLIKSRNTELVYLTNFTLVSHWIDTDCNTPNILKHTPFISASCSIREKSIMSLETFLALLRAKLHL